MNLIKATLSLIVVLLSIVTFAVSASEADIIKFRNIIYLYPESKDLKLPELKKSLNYLKFEEKLTSEKTRPIFTYEVIRDIEKNYPIPDLGYLSYFGRGVEKEQANRIQKANLAIVIDVSYPEKDKFKNLEMVSKSLYEYAKLVDGLIWDSETRELFTPDFWNKTRVDNWQSELPNIVDHTVIHAYKNGDGVRAITLGMAKFGLPDIVVNNFSWSLNDQMGNLINFVGQSLIEGTVPVNKEISLNIKELKNQQLKEILLSSMNDNAEHKIKIEVAKAEWEEGDPDNYLIEILFNNYDGSTLSEKQDSFLSKIFGSDNQVLYIKHTKQIEEESKKAKQKLNGLREDFNNGLNPGEFIILKAPFVTDAGGTEWMWVEVTAWKDNKIKGILKNEPRDITGLSGGTEVEVNQEDVFDYLRSYPDGTSEGNKTGELIMKLYQGDK